MELTLTGDENGPNKIRIDNDEVPWLFHLPSLVRTKILTYLPIRELLRLRLTSKVTNEWSTEFMNKKRKIVFAEQLEIMQGTNRSGSGNGLTFGDILAQGFVFPIQNLYINNENEEIWADPNIAEFIKLYGTGIQKLKIENFSITSKAQCDFFAQLPNLTTLKIQNIDAYVDIRYKHYPELVQNAIPIQTCKKIQVLKIGKICSQLSISTNYHQLFLQMFPNVSTLRYPELCFEEFVPGFDFGWKFSFLKECIKAQSASGSAPLLRKIDLKNLNDYKNDLQFSSLDFFYFVGFLNGLPREFDIKLHNVNERLYDEFDGVDFSNNRLTYRDCIASLKNLSPNTLRLPLLEMEKLDITISEFLQAFYYRSGTRFLVQGAELEQLYSLRVNYDFQVDLFETERIQTTLYQKNYRNLKEFSVKLEMDFGNRKICGQLFRIRNYFLNLKKLELINWNPGNKTFVRLWKKLSPINLAELILKDCSSLGNVALIGEDGDEPVFLRLIGLRKLTLKVDKMDKLTDRAFKDVFRHMSLVEFNLISEHPMVHITRTGIEWLLQGHFANSILKFPFTTWTSTTIPPEEMLPLKSQFKSLIF